MTDNRIDTITGQLNATMEVVYRLVSVLEPDQAARVLADLEITRGTHRAGGNAPEAELAATDKALDIFIDQLAAAHSSAPNKV